MIITFWIIQNQLGKLQHYELGKFFRRRYRSLLGNGEYSRDKVYIQSTDSDRTIMSAAANLAGLFPLKKRNMWTEEMNWQPIPIHSKPDRLDYFVANCSHFNILQKNYMESSARKAWNDKHRLLLTYLTFHSGMPLKTPRDVAVLYDTLKVQSMRNMTWVKFEKKKILERKKFIQNFFLVYPNGPNMYFIMEVISNIFQLTYYELIHEHLKCHGWRLDFTYKKYYNDSKKNLNQN